jgi:hypothetical protein
MCLVFVVNVLSFVMIVLSFVITVLCVASFCTTNLYIYISKRTKLINQDFLAHAFTWGLLALLIFILSFLLNRELVLPTNNKYQAEQIQTKEREPKTNRQKKKNQYALRAVKRLKTVSAQVYLRMGPGTKFFKLHVARL